MNLYVFKNTMTGELTFKQSDIGCYINHEQWEYIDSINAENILTEVFNKYLSKDEINELL